MSPIQNFLMFLSCDPFSVRFLLFRYSGDENWWNVFVEQSVNDGLIGCVLWKEHAKTITFIVGPKVALKKHSFGSWWLFEWYVEMTDWKGGLDALLACYWIFNCRTIVNFAINWKIEIETKQTIQILSFLYAYIFVSNSLH